ncbi:phage virion morphogenesis protein [Candidatus Williamhamiltonella defendens]|uniref:Phage virion morphogenesis protein n=1 Tax=Hamiltonella defensa subsp. Acyrthosiphon pisum (strain 5AT) TaxID=572265 RepID=C4K899_HAMD5|nr:phage virion morphogenesis protein [Candidatus Hamiltonella defensa]ACQ68755.1 phage virion morphogenesis protein [Candidatus Hamiltonella defensa 5AT (Acyrthosiphon pisum)]ATW23277.1 phage virion morphogenesis protein [Candidatus Hamiltonella defensa]
MAGVGASLELCGIERLNPLLDRLGGIDPQQVLSVLGNLVEKQTVDRFIDEKESPDGDKWPEWSQGYAKSRHRHQNLLQSSGDLIDSIQSVFGLGRTDIGTNLMYAARHQFGDTKRGIPQREFLGISADNLVELQNTLQDWADQLIQGAL